MKQALEQKLIERFPEFFRGRHEPLTENLMSFGCECGDGWYTILEGFCHLVHNRIRTNKFRVRLKNNPEENKYRCEEYCVPDFKFFQIKEKYGTFRLYFHLDFPKPENHDIFDEAELKNEITRISAQIDGYETFAEYMSGETCEVCGNPGKCGGRGWIHTLCKEHWHAYVINRGEESPYEKDKLDGTKENNTEELQNT
jgi:hypothetical protein